MTPRMSEPEQRLFESVLRCAEHYFEFGCGGSTVLAKTLVRQSVTSVDSAQDWLDKVQAACADQPGATLQTVFVDIGETGAWGHPTGTEQQARWPDYHSRPFDLPQSRSADLYMVDGRFRVACCLQVLLHCPPQALILFHDFRSRKKYHPVLDFTREVAVAEDLSLLQPKADRSAEAIAALLEQYRLNPE